MRLRTRRTAGILALVVLAAVTACGNSAGGNAGIQGAEASADADVCAYFAPTSLGPYDGFVDPRPFASGDEANATPDLWTLVQTWHLDSQTTDITSSQAQDAAKQVRAIQAWCKGDGFGS